MNDRQLTLIPEVPPEYRDENITVADIATTATEPTPSGGRQDSTLPLVTLHLFPEQWAILEPLIRDAVSQMGDCEDGRWLTALLATYGTPPAKRKKQGRR